MLRIPVDGVRQVGSNEKTSMRLAYALVLVCTACGPEIRMTDDIDLTWDFEFTPKRFDGFLHTPYVVGAPVTVFVTAGEQDDLTGWTITSSDSSVFAITSFALDEDKHAVTAWGQAVGEGTAGLIVEDKKGKQVGVDEAEVLAPDRGELKAHGYLILRQEDQALESELRVVAGGTATYLVNYYNGNRELHGNSVLTVDPTTSVVAQPRTSFLFENREWLTVTAPAAAGTENLTLRANGNAFATVPVVTVPESDLKNMALLGLPEAGHKDGDWLVLLAQAYDATQRRIFGVDYAWTIDGVHSIAQGDLYRYEFKKGDTTSVTAQRGLLSAQTTIQSDTGFVDSTNHIGCNASGGAGGLAALGALGLVRRRRRRV